MIISEKSVLLLLSGGKDSFLAACRLVENGYNLHLVTYDNGCGFQIKNAKSVADRLIKRYSEERVEFLGVKSIVGIWRRFFPLILNSKPTDIAKEFRKRMGQIRQNRTTLVRLHGLINVILTSGKTLIILRAKK